jgi:hypothetical protein
MLKVIGSANSEAVAARMAWTVSSEATARMESLPARWRSANAAPVDALRRTQNSVLNQLLVIGMRGLRPASYPDVKREYKYSDIYDRSLTGSLIGVSLSSKVPEFKIS